MKDTKALHETSCKGTHTFPHSNTDPFKHFQTHKNNKIEESIRNNNLFDVDSITHTLLRWAQ